MLIYRIALAKYAYQLKASGRAARWNSNEKEVIYTSCSRSLACLENIVHRNQKGLNQAFKVMIIEVPNDLKIDEVKLHDLPTDWKEFYKMPFTQSLGDQWIKKSKSLILKVPSAIIKEEHNFLINPLHPAFLRCKLLSVEEFEFDIRIK